ncbi:hypothetical protein ACGC1H_005975 [Rhizoctonia solani]
MVLQNRGHRKRFQQWILSRLQSSPTSFARWVALLELGIFEAGLTGDASQRHFHIIWIGYVQCFLERECTSSSEIQNRRQDWIYVMLLKIMVGQTPYVYQVLRSVTSVFLELVFSNPTLWPTDSNITHVPILNVLTLGSHEVAAFVLMDCVSAMAFGLPQQVEYDTTTHSRLPSPSHQWSHDTPIEFQVALVDINAYRDNSPTARDWREIENLLLTWQSRPGEYTFTDSWMSITCHVSLSLSLCLTCWTQGCM